MRLLRLSEVDKRGATVFRERPGQPVAVVSLLAVIGLTIVVTGVRSDDGFFTFLGVGLLLMTLWIASTARKVFLPSNWVLAIAHGRVLVHFRPYVNTRFPSSDPRVLEIGMDEIASVRITSILLTEVVQRRVMVRTDRYVTFRLKNADLGAFRERLRYERGYRSRGLLTLCHHPVTIEGSDGVRVNWRGTTAALWPKADEAMRLLAAHLPVEKTRLLAVDLTRPETVSEEAREYFLDALVQHGEDVRASVAAGLLYGVGGVEARRILARFDAAAAGEPADDAAPATALPGAR